jgi:hypothetical protein
VNQSLARLLPAVCVATCALLPNAILAERPTAPKLLPKSTLAYVRVADSRELADAFMETASGKLGTDENIRPLISSLYSSASQAFSEAGERIGVSLSELLRVPQGELCFAVVGNETGPPAIVFLIEVGDQTDVARRLLDFIENEARDGGGQISAEDVGGTRVNIIDGDDRVAYCEREGVVLFASDVDLLKEMIGVWDGDEEAETFADNREFTSIMRRSAGTKDERPQITFFVDPIEFFRNASRGNLGAQATLALLPSLGLDGLKSAGGSIILATEEFDSITHIHVMLDSPRQGVLEMLALESGDTTPEDWVPKDAASYMTVNWNLQDTVDAFEKIYDKIRGEGAFAGDLKRRMSDPAGIDVREELLAKLGNRITHVSWFEKQARVNSGTNLIGIELSDASGFRKTVEGLINKFAVEQSFKRSYRGTTYYEFPARRRPPQNLDESLVRQPKPCMAIVGDHLLLSDSTECLQAAISNKKNPANSLAEELDYKLIASKIQHLSGSAQPSMIAFQRPEESMRSFYDLATSPNTRRRLEEAAQNQPFFRALNDALKENPLPPFSQLAKYLAPGGGILISDQTGIHYTTFALKRE